MWELIVTVYVIAAGGQTLIDRQPARVQGDRAACEASAAAVLSAPRENGIRLVAYCAQRGSDAR